ncbi:MAG: glutamine-hydrolyzing GMP synthase [Chloroflexi bacterium]|nr:glutamine-hydrolyzing GMP synthase [Chloroflexota bacterium]
MNSTSPLRHSVPTGPNSPARTHEHVAILDFGSQYTQLIARRVREAHVYCEIVPFDTPLSSIDAANLKGVILSGGPSSVYDRSAPGLADWLRGCEVPLLAICYGMQLLAHEMGGTVRPAARREYGRAHIQLSDSEHALFRGLPHRFEVWMSHGDRIETLPEGFQALATTASSPFAAMGDPFGRIGLQFHPEVAHTAYGRRILHNFLYEICRCTGTWTAERYVDDHVASIARLIRGETALCALSGGVDSAVAATLVGRAIGDRLTCIFVDTGLLREGEAPDVMHASAGLDLKIHMVDASAAFLAALAGIQDPEEKRRRIGALFIDVFEREARALGDVRFLVQGTLYPDVIESATPDNPSAAKIKTHHNVGGLPANHSFTLVEPLRYLFKDEVREVGRALSLPTSMLGRHPFPGPGLAVRVIGEVTPERLNTLRRADAIVVEEIRRAGLYDEIWQAFAVLTPVRTVGVMGDGRTYGDLLALRAVTSEDAMTADWARIPNDVLATISSRITNEVPGVNRVVYDISSKPPSTIEWE